MVSFSLGRPLVTITLLNVTENFNGSLTSTMSLPGYLPRHENVLVSGAESLPRVGTEEILLVGHGCCYAFYVALKHSELSEI